MFLFEWKTCRVCGEELPTTDFGKISGKPGKFRATCKGCNTRSLRASSKYDRCECGAKKLAASALCRQCMKIRNTYDPEFGKKCPLCGETKPARLFGWRMHHGIKRIRSRCKACECERALVMRSNRTTQQKREIKREIAKRSKERYAKDPAYRLERRRSAIRRTCRKYGFGDRQHEIAAMYTLETKCEICGKTPKGRLHIDHCHKTGAYRGFLCDACNNGLGRFRDSVTRLRNAIAYLEKQIVPGSRGSSR